MKGARIEGARVGRRIGAIVLVVMLLSGAIAQALPPRRLVLMPQADAMFVGDTLTLTAEPLPVDAERDVVWNSSNKKLATVDQDGTVTALAPGTVKIRAKAKRRPSVYAVRTLKIAFDPAKADLSIQSDSPAIYEGEHAQLTAVVKPEGAKLAVKWSSSNPRVAAVDAKGKVWGHAAGSATITASIEGGPSATAHVSVKAVNRSTEVPARTTDVRSIAANIEKINAVKYSALGEISRLSAAGTITQADAERRSTIIARAFKMYALPWMTEKTQKYWSRAYGTKKDFFPGIVYYGLPYIQHGLGNNSINRTYNEVKAIAQGFYTDSGKGYYLLSPTKRRDGMYVGNDCSSFVGMSIFGAGNRNALIRTRQLHTSSLYNTLPGFDRLKPGDILVRYNSHVVFFLYYTNAARTEMMILEQGGGNAQDMHNTVTCSIVPVEKYQREKYRPRRLKGLSK